MHKSRAGFIACGVLLGLAALAAQGQQPAPAAAARVAPDAAIDFSRFDLIAPVVQEAIADKKLPGAVVLIGRGDRVLYQKAFGNRSVEPDVEAMTLDTIFDMASLTKILATTTSAMQLIENGRIRLNDRVATFIPGFQKYGKGDITIRHLMTHTSGLRPDLDLGEPWTGYDKAIELAIDEVPTAPPGRHFVYSDINYILLGEIVHRVSGLTLDEYARQHVFAPLGMKDTMFTPPASLRPRIAPTQRCTRYGWPCEGPDMQILRGIVHDPTARRMGGVAGHAGLFSTAADVATFCRMILDGGRYRDVRILSPLAVAKMTTPASPGDLQDVRGLGWDIDSVFSSNRGELLPIGSFGHTGFTGTSIWIDPATRLFVVFMSNRVHPNGKGDVTPLRARVATIAASAVVEVPPGIRADRFTSGTLEPSGTLPVRPADEVLAGIDVLRAEDFAPLRGKRVGLVTNHTGLARDGATTIDLLFHAKGVSLVSLFSPEHGIRGSLDASVPASVDAETKLPIHSLYGQTQRPTPEMLAGLDAIVIDLQDVGVRFYTYTTTMAYVLEEAAKRKLPVFVLDRPNPIDGWEIEGPTIDKDLLGFTGYLPAMPIRHGLTMGELARLFNGENHIGADLTVIAMQHWNREDWFDETSLPWVGPSPNMRDLNEATLYPGIGAIEGTNLSVGRGTDTPFEQVGAPWIDGVRLASVLNARGLPGIRFYPVRFTPASSKYAHEECQGVFLIVTDRSALRPVRVGLEIAAALEREYGSTFDLEADARLIGSRDTITRIEKGEDPASIAESWSAGEARWRLLRAKYLLYR
ncbi:MAG TPA: exo-beta-N-acetylmuramidase NamZ domain-containing protein [Vicinamibacterales bacterium]|nr:exo-beta-N-acetylmuramidase NamZ domain-containing protein [Vicinamibacterales bacterium]